MWLYRVPTLSLFEKLNIGRISTLALFDSCSKSLIGSRATDITLDGWELVLPKATRMTLIVLKMALEEASLRGSDPAWPPWPLGWYRNCFNFPSRTNWSRWSHKILQSSMVCHQSWWYWQWRLWLRLMRLPPILFGHLKNGSFLIFSKTWCTGSQNTTLTI